MPFLVRFRCGIVPVNVAEDDKAAGCHRVRYAPLPQDGLAFGRGECLLAMRQYARIYKIFSFLINFRKIANAYLCNNE